MKVVNEGDFHAHAQTRSHTICIMSQKNGNLATHARQIRVSLWNSLSINCFLNFQYVELTLYYIKLSLSKVC